MYWIVPVSPQERAQGALGPQTARAALAKLDEFGCVLLRGAFDVALIDALHGEYRARYGAADAAAMKRMAFAPPPNPVLEVGEGRFDIAMAMTGVYADPAVFANPLLRKFLSDRLGDDMRLSSLTVVVSHPGAEVQHPHRDHRYLFYDAEASRAVPLYAVNVAVPLIDVDAQTGPTAIWPGSHRWPEAVQPRPETAASVPFQRGDCVLLDYRTMHTGLPNGGALVRPIMYMVYARTWFFDDVNNIGRSALDMSLEQFRALAPDLHPLLSRAFSQNIRASWHKGT